MELKRDEPTEKFASAIDAKLFEELKKACREHGVKIRYALEFGIAKFLEHIKTKEKK